MIIRFILMILMVYLIFGLMYAFSEMYWTGRKEVDKKRIYGWIYYLISGLFGWQ